MNSLSNNSFFNFFSQIAIFLSSLVLSILLARMLGPLQMGQYTFWMWLIGTVALLLTLGLPRAVTRFVSQLHSEGDVKVRQLITRTFIFENKILIVILVGLVMLSFFVNSQDKITYLIVVLTLPVVVLNSLLGSYLQGLQKYNLLFRVNILLSPITLAISLMILVFYRSLNNLLLLNFIVTLISFLISISFIKKYFNFKSEKLPKFVYSEVFKYTVLTSVIVFLDVVLMERSEVFFLRIFSPIEQVAFYSIGFGLVTRVMILIPGAISGVIMPRIAQLYGDNKHEMINQTYYSSTRYLAVFTFPIIFAGILLIDLAVLFLYGDSYSTVIPVTRILLISGGLSAIVAAASSVLYGIGRQDFILKLGILAVAVNLSLDVILIPLWGAIGAALANALAQILGAALGTYYLVRIKRMSFPWWELLKILFSSALVGVIIYLIRFVIHDISYLLSIFLFSPLYILLYLAGLLFLRFFEKRDFDILERVINKVPVAFVRNKLLVLNNSLYRGFSYEK